MTHNFLFKSFPTVFLKLSLSFCFISQSEITSGINMKQECSNHCQNIMQFLLSLQGQETKIVSEGNNLPIFLKVISCLSNSLNWHFYYSAAFYISGRLASIPKITKEISKTAKTYIERFYQFRKDHWKRKHIFNNYYAIFIKKNLETGKYFTLSAMIYWKGGRYSEITYNRARLPYDLTHLCAL